MTFEGKVALITGGTAGMRGGRAADLESWRKCRLFVGRDEVGAKLSAVISLLRPEADGTGHNTQSAQPMSNKVLMKKKFTPIFPLLINVRSTTTIHLT